MSRLELAKGESGTLRVAIGGDWSNIGRAAGAPEVSHWIAMQLAAMGEHGFPVSETATNCALTFVSEMKPRDPAELLRLTQMAAIHQATLTMARRLNHPDTIPWQHSAERALNKLARTFSAQMETLKRYRCKGQQVVRVERVNVEPGAQAVVGHVTHIGGTGPRMENDVSPMDRVRAAPRCTATSKRTGQRCKGPAVWGWAVCRYHGARGGHAPGPVHPRWVHEMRSRASVGMRKAVTQLVREVRKNGTLIS